MMFDPAQPTRIIANGDNRHIFFEVHDRIYGVLGTAIGGEPWQDFAPPAGYTTGQLYNCPVGFCDLFLVIDIQIY